MFKKFRYFFAETVRRFDGIEPPTFGGMSPTQHRTAHSKNGIIFVVDFTFSRPTETDDAALDVDRARFDCAKHKKFKSSINNLQSILQISKQARVH